FANKDTGWSSWIRTNDGGGPIIITSVNNLITLKPDDYILEQNYPNPFNSSTRINFSVPRPSKMTLTIYDMNGKAIFQIYDNEYFTQGNYYAVFDISKMHLSSGIYFYRMTSRETNGIQVFNQTRKCVYIK
ncbi:MAG: T9SS type A sorting domain-containing protein, partial [Ignavibacteria bacterium]|nr:T9SS type A sorting domain-containing protein [Ignavibacteria bacterium]